MASLMVGLDMCYHLKFTCCSPDQKWDQKCGKFAQALPNLVVYVHLCCFASGEESPVIVRESYGGIHPTIAISLAKIIV